MVVTLGALPVLAAFLLAALTPLLSMVTPLLTEAAEDRRRRELVNLPYPPSPFEEGKSVVTRELVPRAGGFVRISTPPTRLRVDGIEENGRLDYELVAARGGGGTEPAGDVWVKLLASGEVELPTWDHDVAPLILTVDGITHRVYSSEFEAKLAAVSRGANNETAMRFTISPELLLAMVSASELSGRIAGYTFTFPEESRNVMQDFASALRPNAGE